MQVSDALGERYQEILEEDFPDFVRIRNPGPSINPDFHSPVGYIEAKCGNQAWGAQLKGFQVQGFKWLRDRPLVYAVGFHNFNHAGERIGGKPDDHKMHVLRREMGIPFTYFVTQKVIDAIWDKEHKIAKNEGRIYCVLKRGILESIIRNREIRRGGEKLMTHRFYGLNLKRFNMQSPCAILPGSRYQTRYGFILDENRDEPVIEYLSERLLIPRRAA